MQLDRFSGGVYAVCNWFVRLAYINLLWILFSVAGLIVFGFFPATIAMLATLRQFLKGNQPAIFKTYWRHYKAEFIKINRLGIIIIAISFVLYANFNFLQTLQSELATLLYYGTIIISCVLVLVICHFLSSYVEFNQPLKTHIKNALLITSGYPLSSLMIIFGFLAVYYVNSFINGLAFFFSGSLLGVVILLSAKMTYQKIEARQSKLEQEKGI